MIRLLVLLLMTLPASAQMLRGHPEMLEPTREDITKAHQYCVDHIDDPNCVPIEAEFQKMTDALAAEAKAKADQAHAKAVADRLKLKYGKQQ